MNTAEIRSGKATSYTMVILEGPKDLSKLQADLLNCGYSPITMANYRTDTTQLERISQLVRAQQTLSSLFSTLRRVKKSLSSLLAP